MIDQNFSCTQPALAITALRKRRDINSMEVIIGNNPEIILKARSIRHQVFVVEQSIPQELDLDGLDNDSHHVLVTDADASVATARLHIKENGHSVMARVAVIKEYRGMGIASKVVKSLMDHAQQQGASMIEIHAHEFLKSYYEKFGFTFVRDVEVVGEHQLIEMRYQVSST
jgi:predicted GNAT family N-acyltransferase